jgi:hypothetical protein
LPDICVSSLRRSTAPCDKAASFASPGTAANRVTHKRVIREGVTHKDVGMSPANKPAMPQHGRDVLFLFLSSMVAERKSIA